MKVNKAMAFVVVTILLVCPVIAVYANTDDSTGEKTENAAMIELVKVQDEDASKIVNLEISQFFPLLCLQSNNATSGFFFIEWNPSDINDSIGMKRTMDSNKLINDTFVDLSFSFVLKLTAIKDKVKLNLMDMNYCSGEAKDELMNFLGQEFDEGRCMEIKGSIVKRADTEIIDEYNVNNDGQYLLKDRIGAITAKYTIIVNYKYGDKTLETKTEAKTIITQKTNCAYTSAWELVRNDDEYSMKPETTNVEKLEMGMIVKTVRDTELGMNIDQGAAKKQMYVFKEESNLKAKWLTPEQNDSNGDTISAKVKFSEIAGLNESTKKMTDDQIKENVQKIKGKTSTDINEFNKKTDSIKNDVNGSSSNDNTWIWITVAVVVILIIAGLTLWYFKYRKPSA